MPVQCDVFCSVIDNFGDAGVCWRLARQLNAQFEWTVRLWIDDVRPLRAMVPELQAMRSAQTVQGVQVCCWDAASRPDTEPASVVIEAFACTLPQPYVERMALQPRVPVWVNLEYLSAEPWVAGVHALPSPHPYLPLTKTFFFPGFDGATGGLNREIGLDGWRSSFLKAGADRSFLSGLREGAGQEKALSFSLFCYDNPALDGLLQAWRDGARPVECFMPADRYRKVAAGMGKADSGRDTVTWGQVSLFPIPFLPQQEYDQLLWSCDLNFVRGEDSFLRAQFAAKPMIWHIYPQDDGAHWGKLEAWSLQYVDGMQLPQRAAWLDFSLAWNAGDPEATRQAWPAFASYLDDYRRHARAWADRLFTQPSLAEKLVAFCAERLK